MSRRPYNPIYRPDRPPPGYFDPNQRAGIPQYYQGIPNLQVPVRYNVPQGTYIPQPIYGGPSQFFSQGFPPGIGMHLMYPQIVALQQGSGQQPVYAPPPRFSQQQVYPPPPGFSQQQVYPPPPGFSQQPVSHPPPEFSQQPIYAPPPGFDQPPGFGPPLPINRPTVQTDISPPEHQNRMPLIDIPENIKDYYSSLDIKIEDRYKLDVYNLGQRRYLLAMILGSGTYAVVHKAKYVENLGGEIKKKLAIKISRVTALFQNAVYREIHIVDKLMNNPHPNITRFLDRFRSTDRNTYYMVMERALGDLYGKLLETNLQGRMTWVPLLPQYCQHLIKGVAKGVKHLFSLGISHGDIKLENILVYGIEPDISVKDYFKMIPKLADFNNSKMVVPGAPIIHHGARCTLYTAAPETYFTNVPYDMIKADVYSVGGCLLAMLLACQPFRPPGRYPVREQLERRSIMMKKDKVFIKQLVQPFELELRQLLIRVLEPEPQNRITIDQFLADNWFRQGFQSQEIHEIPVQLPPKTSRRLQDFWTTRTHSF